MQVFMLIPLLLIYIFLMNLPTIIFLKYFQWSWMKSIFGPYLINVNIWIAGWLTIGTVGEIYIAFPHFNPMIGLK